MNKSESEQPVPWRAKSHKFYYRMCKGILYRFCELGDTINGCHYEDGNYFQTEELALASLKPKEPEKWIPKKGEDYWQLNSRNELYSYNRQRSDDSFYKHRNCYPTIAAALASLIEATEEQLEERLEEVNAELASIKPVEEPKGVVDKSATIEQYKMIERDGWISNPEYQIKPIAEPPHPHTNSWVPAFEMNTGPAHKYCPMKRYEV